MELIQPELWLPEPQGPCTPESWGSRQSQLMEALGGLPSPHLDKLSSPEGPTAGSVGFPATPSASLCCHPWFSPSEAGNTVISSPPVSLGPAGGPRCRAPDVIAVYRLAWTGETCGGLENPRSVSARTLPPGAARRPVSFLSLSVSPENEDSLSRRSRESEEGRTHKLS